MDHESEKVFLYEGCVTEDTRLDVFVSGHLPEVSRSRVQSLIKSGHVTVNHRCSKPSYTLKPGDVVGVRLPPPAEHTLSAEVVRFEIVHEDASLIVIDKPAGVVVHPAPGHLTGTLVHGLLHHCTDLSGIGGVLRPGIVHRLDKDTSGLMVVAKHDRSHAALSHQFKTGAVHKQYLALVHGLVDGTEGEIDLPIARHQKKRKQMAVCTSGGRRALTRWKRLAVFDEGFSLLSVSLGTGRTHQIRVHLSHMGHPVAGDPVYGHGPGWWKRHPHCRSGLVPAASRQLLHAERLGFTHPDLDRFVEFRAPVPDDFALVLSALERLKAASHGPQ